MVPRAGTSFIQCFAWSAKRGQMCLVCPTPCAVRLGITGAEHTRPCWYLCWFLFRTVLCLVSPGNVSLARARTRTEQPNAGKCAQFALPLAQFAWVSRALNILARVGTWLVPLSYSASLGQPSQCITCPGSYSYWSAKRGQMCLVFPTPFAVRLGITGAEHTRPCWYLCWYLFRTVLRSACTVLRLVRTGHVPTCPCSHLYRYLLCSWTARALYLLPVSLMYLRVRATCPRLYPCTVFCYGSPEPCTCPRVWTLAL